MLNNERATTGIAILGRGISPEKSHLLHRICILTVTHTHMHEQHSQSDQRARRKSHWSVPIRIHRRTPKTTIPCTTAHIRSHSHRTRFCAPRAPRNRCSWSWTRPWRGHRMSCRERDGRHNQTSQRKKKQSEYLLKPTRHTQQRDNKHRYTDCDICLCVLCSGYFIFSKNSHQSEFVISN